MGSTFPLGNRDCPADTHVEEEEEEEEVFYML